MAKQEYPCTISAELHQTWQRLMRRGDVLEMRKVIEYSGPTIRRALNHGYVTVPELPDLINKFFMDRLNAEKKAAATMNAMADQA